MVSQTETERVKQFIQQRVRTMSESPRRLQPSASAAASEARRRSDSARETAETAAEEQRRASDSGARFARRSVR